MAAALPQPPQMLVGRSGEGEEGWGRSGAGWRWGSLPGRGDSLPHQSCEPQTALILLASLPIPGQIVLPLPATEEVTTVA